VRLDLASLLSPVQRLSYFFVRLATGGHSGAVLMVSAGKPFGGLWTRCMDEGMRQARHWSRGEIELFAAFVSKLNACGF